ncbi:MAG: thermonuclease family protein [Candidatus Pacearchaeota archaeon]
MRAKRIIIFFLVLILLYVFSLYYPVLTGKAVNENNRIYEKERCFVEKIVDGDTIICDNESIRLLGINTPEKGKPYSKEAVDFLKRIENKSIEILRDKEDIDKYNRKLRYVFYDNRMLNTEILEQGLATSFMLNALKYKDNLARAEVYAKNNGFGLWKKSLEVCANCIKLVELNYSEEYFILRNKCDFNCLSLEAKDDANHFFKINLNANEEKRFDSKTKIWNDDGDRLFIRDEQGNLILFYEY